MPVDKWQIKCMEESRNTWRWTRWSRKWKPELFNGEQAAKLNTWRPSWFSHTVLTHSRPIWGWKGQKPKASHFEPQSQKCCRTWDIKWFWCLLMSTHIDMVPVQRVSQLELRVITSKPHLTLKSASVAMWQWVSGRVIGKIEMAVSELDLQLEFYINGVAILIIASLGILGNILSLLLFKFRYLYRYQLLCPPHKSDTTQCNHKYKNSSSTTHTTH